MNERDMFIKAICEQPDEDTHRLVFADWLEEHGEPDRAEFIRVQCELAANPYRIEMRFELLHQREKELFPHRCQKWFPNPDLHNERAWEWKTPHISENHGCSNYMVSRGFVYSVRCTTTTWLEHADVIFWHPEQTEQCPNCKPCNHGYTGRYDSLGVAVRCWTCKGKGRIPRPFVATAQPIREVTLTTIWGLPFKNAGDAVKPIYVSDLWPGITFHLPRT